MCVPVEYVCKCVRDVCVCVYVCCMCVCVNVCVCGFFQVDLVFSVSVHVQCDILFFTNQKI